MSPRGPDDYDHEDDDIRRLAGLIERLAMRPTYQEAAGDSTKAIVIGVGITLLSTFVIGGWVLSTRLSALEATVTAWQANQQDMIKANTQRIERLENRR